MPEDKGNTILQIEFAENGGYIVLEKEKSYGSVTNTAGAYTNTVDLIEALPELLGADALDVIVQS